MPTVNEIATLQMKRERGAKKMNELELAVEILKIVSNVNGRDDALEYARIYLEAQTEAAKVVGDEYKFDENEVYRLLAETDRRFNEVSK